MAAERVHFVECLREWIWVLVFGAVGVDGLPAGAVNLDTGRAGSGQEVCGRDGEREDVGGMRVRDGQRLEVLLRLQAKKKMNESVVGLYRY